MELGADSINLGRPGDDSRRGRTPCRGITGRRLSAIDLQPQLLGCPGTPGRLTCREITMPCRRIGSLVFVAHALSAVLVAAQEAPEETEVWEPVPPVVVPGAATGPVRPPSDALVLFDGTGLDEWVGVADGAPARWLVSDGVVTVDKSAGNIETRRRFRDYQLHIEWRVPEGVTGSGQARGNSGIYLAWAGEPAGGYELQILDSYQNETYVNGMAGSIYKQSIPLVNPSRPPGEWQTYDVVWSAPRFGPRGSVESPARVTVLYNGILVQNDFTLSGATVYVGTPEYRPHGDAPLMLQAHGDPSPPISFRNIWLRELRGRPSAPDDAPVRVGLALDLVDFAPSALDEVMVALHDRAGSIVAHHSRLHLPEVGQALELALEHQHPEALCAHVGEERERSIAHLLHQLTEGSELLHELPYFARSAVEDFADHEHLSSPSSSGAEDADP